MKIFFYLLCTSFLLAWRPARCQSDSLPRLLRGRVYGLPTKEPLPGASLVMLRGRQSAVTDGQGYFSIFAINHDTLNVRNLGYRAVRISVDTVSGFLQVYLPTRSTALSEVLVSTGYQQVDRSRATGSFEQIDPHLYDRAVGSNVLDKLEGLSSSLYFSKTTGNRDLYIRGLSSLSAGTEPLVVVDNFPYEGDLSNLDPEDVESISILKDAAAASIWGARSGNGVIVVTTKEGRYNTGPKVSLDASLRLQNKPDLYYDRSWLDAGDFIDVERYLFAQGAYDDELSNPTGPVVSPVVALLGQVRSGRISEQVAAKQIDQFRSYDLRRDMLKYLYRGGLSQQYNVNYSVGGNNLNYLLNVSYANNIGNVVGVDQRRVVLHSVTNFRPLTNLHVKVGVHYTWQQAHQNGLTQIIPQGKSTLYPYARLVDGAGDPLSVPYGHSEIYADTTGGGLLLDWKYRPLEEQRGLDIGSMGQDILLDADVSYDVLSGLVMSVKGQIEKSVTQQHNYNSAESYFSRNLVNEFSAWQGDKIIHQLPAGGILDQDNGRLSAADLRGQLNYHKSWRQEHELDVLAGAELRQDHRLAEGHRTYGYDNDLLTYTSVDYVNGYYLWDGLGYGYIPDNSSFSDASNRFVSLFGNASYHYRGKYMVSGSVRKDASNLFGVSTNHKWNPFLSTGLSWDFSKEPFYPFPWLPSLRIRMTYGFNGNVKNDLAAVPTIFYYPADGGATNLPSAIINSLPNPDLRWERVGIWNTGLDLGSAKGRIQGSVEYYYKRSIDLLAPTPVDPTTGVSTMTLNSANLSTQGVDLQVSIRWLDKSFGWTTRIYAAFVRNRVTRYLKELSSLGGLPGTSYTITPLQGKDPYALISYRWYGLDSAGNPMSSYEGKPSENYQKISNDPSWDDLVVGRTTRPPYYGNIINTFHWKGFELTASLAYKFGYDFRKSSINYNNLFNSWLGNADFQKRWQHPGDEHRTDVPSMIYPSNYYRGKVYTYSAATVDPGGLLRLQDLSLSCDINKPPFGVHGIQHLKLYLYAQNIGLLWRANHDGIDPDYGQGLPEPFSCAFGVKANF